jgi:hypothetical protein
MEENVRWALQRDYGDHDGPLNMAPIGGGASPMRKSLHAIFGTTPAMILNGYQVERHGVECQGQQSASDPQSR